MMRKSIGTSYKIIANKKPMEIPRVNEMITSYKVAIRCFNRFPENSNSLIVSYTLDGLEKRNGFNIFWFARNSQVKRINTINKS